MRWGRDGRTWPARVLVLVLPLVLVLVLVLGLALSLLPVLSLEPRSLGTATGSEAPGSPLQRFAITSFSNVARTCPSASTASSSSAA